MVQVSEQDLKAAFADYLRSLPRSYTVIEQRSHWGKFWSALARRGALRRIAQAGLDSDLKFKEGILANDKVAIKNNKYYVGSDSVFTRNWGHPTLDGAVQHGAQLIESEEVRDQVFVVQIVRVVKRKKIVQPIEVISVK